MKSGLKILALILFLTFKGCKEESTSNVLGKWKVLGPENIETNMAIEFRKDQYLLENLNDNTVQTFNYKWEGKNIISNILGSSETDTAIFNFVNQDSIIVTTPKGVYTTLIRYKE